MTARYSPGDGYGRINLIGIFSFDSLNLFLNLIFSLFNTFQVIMVYWYCAHPGNVERNLFTLADNLNEWSSDGVANCEFIKNIRV